MSNPVYLYVQDRIVATLNEAITNGGGLAPWQKPWHGGMCNYISRKPYRGINRLLLPESGEYITFKQIKELQKAKKYSTIKLKKKAKRYLIVFWKITEIDEDETNGAEVTDERKVLPLLRYYYVYNIKDVEGLMTKFTKTKEFKPIENAEKISSNYLQSSGVTLETVEGTNEACYMPGSDTVQMPAKSQFNAEEPYYAALFHEYIHSTGHKSRLNREFGLFGDGLYTTEELVAEIGSAMIYSDLGFSDAVFNNSVAYLNNWLSQISGDVKLVTNAAQRAQKAADLVLVVTLIHK